MNSGCGMEYALMERKKKIITLLMGGKRLLHVLTATRCLPETFKSPYTVRFDITYLSNLLNLLGYSSFLEQLL